MAIYFQEHELDNRELNDYLTAWPTKLVDGSYVIASHADLLAEMDFDTAPATVNAAISSTLQAAGVSAAKDAIAPDWVVVTLPADSEYPAEEVSIGRWGTVWETRARDLEQHTFCLVIEEPVIGARSEPGPFPVTGQWRIRDRYDRWLGANGHLAQLESA